MKSTLTWSRKFDRLLLLLLGLSVPMTWIVGYSGLFISQLISFSIADGWCVAPTEPIGQHCFGDYASMDEGLAAGDLYNPTNSMSTPYPPTSLLIPYLFHGLGTLTGSYEIGRNAYLIALMLSIISPALYVSIKLKSLHISSLVLVGIAATPLLVTVDRGNTFGFAVPGLLIIAIGLVSKRPKLIVIGVLLATLVKPQLAIFALAFLSQRKVFLFLGTSVLSATTVIAGFFFVQGSVINNVLGWLKIITVYPLGFSADSYFPYNPGMARTIVSLFELFRIDALFPERFNLTLKTWLIGNTSLIAVLLILVTASLLYLKRPTNAFSVIFLLCTLSLLIPSSAFGYYLCLLVVPATMMLVRFPVIYDLSENTSSSLDDLDFASPRSDFSKRVLITCTALILTPLAIPISVDLLFSSSLQGTNVGLLQSAWGVLCLIIFVTLIVSISRSPKKGRSIVSSNA